MADRAQTDAERQRMTPPARSPDGAPVPSHTTGDGVVAHYMGLMHNFLKAEQRVMEAYLAAGRRSSGAARSAPQTADGPAVGPDNQAGPLPLVGEVLSLIPGQSLLARRRIDPDEDMYLHDHTFGGAMSVMDPTLEPLTVAPLTMSLELMAEAAAQVLPDLVLTGMADIKAHRWVQVDESAPTILEITARIVPTDPASLSDSTATAVRVEVREIGADGASGAMVIEGTCLFGSAYEPAPPPEPFTPANPRPTIKSAAAMYGEKWMFHGPLFQGVASLDVSGDDGIVGTLAVLPAGGLFRSTAQPRLLTDVALLDAAGQLLGYWAKERLATSFLVFPIRVADVHVYRPNLPAGTRVRCDVHITEIMPQTIEVNMTIFDAEGSVWMRVCGWQDWRFDLAGEVYEYWRFPNQAVLSKPFPAPLPRGPGIGPVTCCRLDKPKELGQAMIAKSLAYMTLNHAERRTYHGLHESGARQLDWLAGRIAAKDAVRLYLWQRYGLQVGPGDVEIAADAHGRPIATGAWVHQIGASPSISLAHADGVAIAVAGHAPGGIGIDLQRISPLSAEFDAIAFDREELATLHEVDGAARDERRLRFWCAKEAVAKALGRGLLDGPRSVAIETWDDATGVAGAGVRGALAAALPPLAGRRIAAYTVRDGEYIVATSFAEMASVAEAHI